jgi:cytoskeletal protein RodZ
LFGSWFEALIYNNVYAKITVRYLKENSLQYTAMPKQRISPKLITAALIGGLLVLGGGVIGWQRFHNNSQNTTPTDNPITTSPSDQEPVRSDSPASPDKDEDIPAKQPTKNPTTTTSSSLSVDITYHSFNEDTNKAVIRAMVDGATQGTCTATFKKSGYSAVTQTSNVELATSYYTCGKLELARSRFPAAGTWSVSVTLNSGGKSVTSSSETITIK